MTSPTRDLLPRLAAAAIGCGRGLMGSLRDLLPIVVVIAVFQLLVFRQPLDNLLQVATEL
jgi:hypothetical protein